MTRTLHAAAALLADALGLDFAKHSIRRRAEEAAAKNIVHARDGYRSTYYLADGSSLSSNGNAWIAFPPKGQELKVFARPSLEGRENTPTALWTWKVEGLPAEEEAEAAAAAALDEAFEAARAEGKAWTAEEAAGCEEAEEARLSSREATVLEELLAAAKMPIPGGPARPCVGEVRNAYFETAKGLEARGLWRFISWTQGELTEAGAEALRAYRWQAEGAEATHIINQEIDEDFTCEPNPLHGFRVAFLEDVGRGMTGSNARVAILAPLEALLAAHKRVQGIELSDGAGLELYGAESYGLRGSRPIVEIPDEWLEALELRGLDAEGEIEWEGSIESFAEANEEDEELLEAIRALAPGESYSFGGGAAAAGRIERLR